eukprot:1178026-Prorocentrum_minimum.AAC.2
MQSAVIVCCASAGGAGVGALCAPPMAAKWHRPGFPGCHVGAVQWAEHVDDGTSGKSIYAPDLIPDDSPQIEIGIQTKSTFLGSLP